MEFHLQFITGVPEARTVRFISPHSFQKIMRTLVFTGTHPGDDDEGHGDLGLEELRRNWLKTVTKSFSGINLLLQLPPLTYLTLYKFTKAESLASLPEATN